MSNSFVILWKFRVREGRTGDFEQAYGKRGDWVRFFQKGAGYVKTELYRGPSGEYLTVDEWSSPEAYEEFRKSFLKEYQELDRRFESLTETETHIGSFVRL